MALGVHVFLRRHNAVADYINDTGLQLRQSTVGGVGCLAPTGGAAEVELRLGNATRQCTKALAPDLWPTYVLEVPPPCMENP